MGLTLLLGRSLFIWNSASIVSIHRKRWQSQGAGKENRAPRLHLPGEGRRARSSAVPALCRG